MTDIILNSLVIILLSLTILFCWKLNKKIIELKSSKTDMLNLVKSFDTAIVKTNKSISDLKVMSANSTVELQNYLNKATELINDLSFMTETASKLADRLETGILDVRKTNYPQPHKEHSNDQLEQMISSIGNMDNNSNKKAGFINARNDLMSALKFIKNTSS
jgi:hypothetical protein